MKNTRKFLAIFMVIAMIMSMGVLSAFAATTGSVKNETDRTYDAYQIFSGTQAEDDAVLGNIAWGSGIKADSFLPALKNLTVNEATPFATCTDAAAVAEVLKNYSDNTEVAKAFARLAVKYVADTATTVAANEEKTLDSGYYLLVDTSKGNESQNPALLQVTNDGDLNITDKSDAPEVVKKITDGTDKTVKLDKNEQPIGGTEYYVITGTLPDNLSDYETYYYNFKDTLSKGLTYNEDMKVYVVNGDTKTNVTDQFIIDAGTYDATNGTTITVGIYDLLTIQDVTSTTTIVLEYSATVNENAVINDANSNVVELEYDNNPNDEGDGEYPDDGSKPPFGTTPPDEVKTYVTEVHINKIDGNGNALTGATFKITGSALKTVLVTTYDFEEDVNGEYWKLKDGTYTKQDPNGTIDDKAVDQTKYESVDTKYTMTESTEAKNTADEVKAEAAVGEDGKLTFTGLGEGTYTIKETVTPAGYNTVADITLKVTFDAENEVFTYVWTGGAEGNTNSIDVVNNAGSELPETGGMGTALLIGAGSVIALAAALFLVTKKRVKNAEV